MKTATSTAAQDEKIKTELKKMLKQPDNKFCAGIHRNLGVHISTVKSTELDTWKKEWYETMKEWGNEKVNKLWEYSLPENSSAKPNETESQNLSAKHKQFIRDKYEKKLWYKPQKISKSNGKTTTSKKKSAKESEEESSSSSSSDNEDSDSSSDSAPKSKSKGKSTTTKQKETSKSSSASTKQTTKAQPATSKATQSKQDDDLFGFGAFSEPVAAVTAGMSTMQMSVPTASVAATSAIPTAIPVDAPPTMQPKKTIDLASLYSASVPQYAPMGGMPGVMYPPQQMQSYPGMMPMSYQAPPPPVQQQQAQQYQPMMMYPPQTQQPMMYQQPGQSPMIGYPMQQQQHQHQQPPQQSYYQQQIPMMSIPTQPSFGMLPTTTAATANKNDPFSGLY